MSLSKMKSNKFFIYFLSFLMPVLLMLLVCILAKVYPFGNNTLLISDCDNQYINYLSYFKTIFTDNNNFLYTFSKSLGGDMIGLAAYYLFSPLNFILLFFSNEHLPVAILLIVVIKIGLCGLTFNYFINKGCMLAYKSIIFSTSYALMAYNMAYFWDVMWLDGVILLPLMILGIDKILSSNKPYLYIMTLFAALVTNYYIGWMLCIFSIIYFIFKLSLDIDHLKELKLYIKRILVYIVSSLLSAGLAAIVLIPTFFSLAGGKATFSMAALVFQENYKFIDVFPKLYTNTISSNELISGLPNIFCGIFIIALVILYFFNSKIKTKEKILGAGLLAVILISFHINSFNLIWHGFNQPSWFPYRYSFVFSFLLITLAYRCFCNLYDGIKDKHLIYSAIIFVISSIVIFQNNYDFVSINYIYLDLFLMIIFCLLLYLHKNSQKRKNFFIIFIALIHMGNLSLNAFGSMRKLQAFSSSKMDSYRDYIQHIKPAIDSIKEDDKGFYRIEKTFQRTNNDPMQFNYNGLSHFSSSEKTFVKSFLGKMGFRNNENWVYYNNGSTISVDSFLGVKYLLSEKRVDKPYDALYSKNEIDVFKNQYAMPIGWVVSSKIHAVDLNTDNLFNIQNNIFSSMSDKQFDNIFSPAEVIDISLDNLSVTKLFSSTIYERINPSSDALITYKIKINNPNTLYTYINAPEVQMADIFINEVSLGIYFDTYRWDIVSLGTFNVGDIITFKIQVNNQALELNEAYFYYENIDTLKQYYDELSSEPCNFRKINSSHLRGTVNVLEDNKYLLFTIPYEKDWQVTIDEKKIKPTMVFDALMAIPISKGEHTIEFKYIPRGLYLGIGIAAFSLVNILSYAVWSHQKKTGYESIKTK